MLITKPQAPLICFSNGLVLSRGARTLQFKRRIDHKSDQYEYSDTCEVITLSKSVVLGKIARKEWSVVAPGAALGAAIAEADKGSVFMDISSLTADERTEFEWRLAYVKGIRKRGIKKGQRGRIRHAIQDIASALSDRCPPSENAVMNWMRKYERADDNPYVLVTRRRLVRHESPISKFTADLIWRGIETIYLTRERRTVRDVWVYVIGTLNRLKKANQLPAEEDGRHQVSERTIYRRIQEIDPFERDRKRYGEVHARNKWRYSLNTEVVIHPMQRVEVDSTQLDIYVLDDRLGILLGRPWITVVVDRYSGYILGFYVSFAGTSIQSALGAIKASILPKGDIVKSISGIEHHWLAEGIAWLYVFDNGLEFQSMLFRNVIQFELRAELQFCAVRSPWLKPTVERTIGMFNQNALPRRGHTFGLESWSEFNPSKHAAISFSELCQILVRWVTDIHPFKVNERKIATPYDLFSEGIANTPIAPFCTDADRLDFIAGIKKSCTVNKEGVAFSRLQYHSAQLRDVARSIDTTFKTNMKFDPEDLGCIYVQHPKTEEWFDVPCTRPDYATGLSLKQHDQIRRFRREKLNAQHDVDGNIEALLKFQEHIQSLLRGRPSIRTSANAAKFANLTSAKVLVGQPQSILDSKAARTVTKDELIPAFRDVPDFEVNYVI